MNRITAVHPFANSSEYILLYERILSVAIILFCPFPSVFNTISIKFRMYRTSNIKLISNCRHHHHKYFHNSVERSESIQSKESDDTGTTAIELGVDCQLQLDDGSVQNLRSIRSISTLHPTSIRASFIPIVKWIYLTPIFIDNNPVIR